MVRLYYELLEGEEYKMLETILNNQQLFLSKELNMRRLKKAEVLANEKFLIYVQRTMPFEFMESALKSFGNFIGRDLSFKYSTYDSTLGVINDEDADCVIFWMDWRLYMDKMEPSKLIEWLKMRIISIEKQIFINNWPTIWSLGEQQFASNIGKRGWIYELNYLLEQLKNQLSTIEIIDLNLFASCRGIESFDERNDQISNFPLSNKLSLEISRHIVNQLIASITSHKLKLIIVDMDNTMYHGIIGEDRIENVEITIWHKKFQKLLKKLKDNGILLAIASKNDRQDVLRCIKEHPQMLLKKEDFIFIEANWETKSKSIQKIINNVNIDSSAVLFIDDNPAELLAVKTQISDIHVLLADMTGEGTFEMLNNYPFLYSRHKDETSLIRQQDILANVKRKQLKDVNDGHYLKSLQMKITVFKNNADHMQRVYELGQKTNQFNLSLKRYTEMDIKKFFNNESYDIFTITLSDILNDSGIIGVFIIEKHFEEVHFKEVLFSCRALGRLVEDASLKIILQSEYPDVKKIYFDKLKGPRNKPALTWVESILVSDQYNEVLKKISEKISDFKAEVKIVKENNSV